MLCKVSHCSGRVSADTWPCVYVTAWNEFHLAGLLLLFSTARDKPNLG